MKTLMSYEDALALLVSALSAGQRVALIGASGAGKSMLAALAADRVDGPLCYISADPGRPGAAPAQPPGALARCVRQADAQRWRVEALEGLATMDCARHRLPLVSAVAKLAPAREGEALLLDTPGIVRGVQAVELLCGLCQVLKIELILALWHEKHDEGLLTALAATGAQVVMCQPSTQAKKLSDGQRQSARDAAWAGYLAAAQPERLLWSSIKVFGVPIAFDAPDAWDHYQVVLLGARGQTLGLGSVERATAESVTVRWPRGQQTERVSALLVRDVRQVDGKLRTFDKSAQAAEAPAVQWADEERGAPEAAFMPRQRAKVRIHLSDGPMVAGSSIRVTFIGDLFDDPMVLLRLDHRQRCLWFDAGEVAHVPTRFVHQTSDIFLSHAHLDHFGDFPWLLRRLMGQTEPVRIWGPVGIIERVWHMVQAFTWDRIGERGPRFLVYAWDGGEQARCALVQAGIDDPVEQEPWPIGADGLLFREPLLKVSATVLDHGGLPVLAYAVEETHQFAVRGNVLRERGWVAGQWLGQLKVLAAQEEVDAQLDVELAQGGVSSHRVGELIEALLIDKPGQKIVYATDFGDTQANRDKIVPFAQGAHLFLCETSFVMGDLEQAERTGHMTTQGCARIAREAGVRWLVPFHHSMRYELCPEVVYRELLAGFESTYVPAPIRKVLAASAQAVIEAGQSPTS